MDLLSGLLGGVQGGSNAVNTLSEERRKQLAEQVRMEALDLMNKRQQERGFAHSKDLQQGQFTHAEGMQGRQFEHAEGMQRGGFEHAENMQGRQFEHAEGLLGKQLSSAERRHRESLAAGTDETGTAKADLASKDAHNKINEVYKTLLDKGKWKEGQKLPGWAMTQINAIRRDAGMPELSEEETKVPKWFGTRSETKYTYDEGLLPTTQPEVESKETTKPTTETKPTEPFDWTKYVPQNTEAQPAQIVEAQPVVTNDEVSRIAIQLGVNPNSLGRYKKRIWEKLSDEAKARYGSYDNFDKSVK